MANTAVSPVSLTGKQFVTEPLPINANGSGTDFREMQVGLTTGNDAVVTLNGTTDRGVALARIHYGYRTAPTAGSIVASDGTNQFGPFTVTLAGLQLLVFNPPILFAKNANVTITLKDGSVTKDLYAQGYLEGNELI